MKEVRRLYTERQVSDALAMRNGPNTEQLLTLPLQSDVRGWREKYGPYKVLAMNGQTCTIQMPYEQTNFRSTVVKPYYAEEMDKSTPTTSQDNTPSDITITVDHPEEDTIVYHNRSPCKARLWTPERFQEQAIRYLTALDSFLSKRGFGARLSFDVMELLLTPVSLSKPLIERKSMV
jgi:hypothetical protein